MPSENRPDFESWPAGEPLDETDVSLRAYITRLSEEHLTRYRADWTDDQVAEWDGNFRSDGNLMLVCCERDIDVPEFRRLLEEYLRWKK